MPGVEAFTLEGYAGSRPGRWLRHRRQRILKGGLQGPRHVERWPLEGVPRERPGGRRATKKCLRFKKVQTKHGMAERCAAFGESRGGTEMAAKRKKRKSPAKRRVCTSKKTGRRVSCARQAAGRKAARKRKRGGAKRKTKSKRGGKKYCVSKTTGKRVSCARQRAGRKAARARKRR